MAMDRGLRRVVKPCLDLNRESDTRNVSAHVLWTVRAGRRSNLHRSNLHRSNFNRSSVHRSSVTEQAVSAVSGNCHGRVIATCMMPAKRIKLLPQAMDTHHDDPTCFRASGRDHRLAKSSARADHYRWHAWGSWTYMSNCGAGGADGTRHQSGCRSPSHRAMSFRGE